MAELEKEAEVVESTPEATFDPTLQQRRPRKVNAGMWGVPEAIAASIGALAVLIAILVFFFLVVPSNSEVTKNRNEANRLGDELVSAQSKYGQITDTKTRVSELLTSVDDFEVRFLPLATNGRTSIYQRINGLIGAYGLVNTTGPDYQPLETVDQNDGSNKSEEERGRERFRSLFPGVYVTMTLEGSYQNLRRFIKEIETGNEFVIVSSVELAPSESEQKKTEGQTQPAGTQTDPNTGQPINRGPVEPANKPKGKMHGEVVALRLEMAAYFRRANYSPMATGQQQ
ncbi:MAG TPA: hypothetical protein PKA82_09100 [Pyrinomonadaceae bacterium]|nr:hypothetical protein [Pyrinomonadaceae bacterium]